MKGYIDCHPGGGMRKREIVLGIFNFCQRHGFFHTRMTPAESKWVDGHLIVFTLAIVTNGGGVNVNTDEKPS